MRHHHGYYRRVEHEVQHRAVVFFSQRIRQCLRSEVDVHQVLHISRSAVADSQPTPNAAVRAVRRDEVFAFDFGRARPLRGEGRFTRVTRVTVCHSSNLSRDGIANLTYSNPFLRYSNALHPQRKSTQTPRVRRHRALEQHGL